MGFGKKLPHTTKYHLLVDCCSLVPAGRYKFGNTTNNELLNYKFSNSSWPTYFKYYFYPKDLHLFPTRLSSDLFNSQISFQTCQVGLKSLHFLQSVTG